MENEKSVLRWGSVAGILAFIVWIVEMPLYGFVDPFEITLGGDTRKPFQIGICYAARR